jgi:hypothetical protein
LDFYNGIDQVCIEQSYIFFPLSFASW